MVELRKYVPTPALSDEEWKARVIKRHPQSILTTTGEINRRFGSLLDEAPIEEVVSLHYLPGTETLVAELTEIWQGINLLPRQKEMILSVFVLLRGSDSQIRTIGDIRGLTERERRISRTVIGLGRIKDVWLEGSFRKAEETAKG